MKVLCSACSLEHDLSPVQLAEGASCTRCGQNLGADQATLIIESKVATQEDATLLMPSREAAPVVAYQPPRSYSMPSRAREGLKTATKDLFGFDPPRPVLISATEIEPDVPTPRASENSIMFSLENLMKGNNRATPKVPPPDALSEHYLLDMQGTAPLFGTAEDHALLTTPIAKPTPPAHTMTMPSRRPARRKSGMWKWAASGIALCAVAAAGWWGVRAAASGPHDTTEPVAEAPPVVAPPAEPAPPSEPVAAAVPSPEVTPSPAPSADQPPEAATAAPGEPAAAASAPLAPASDAPLPAASAAPATPPASTKGKAKLDKKVAVSAKPKGAAVVGLPFNKAAAKDALTSASSKVSVCKGASGAGKVQLTFAPSGKVSNASITSGSFPGAVGACILRQFRAARVPPFGGLPVSVAKSFKIP
jgi:hypothetical protein